MKEKLNLRALRRSGNVKHTKIYKKATRMITEGFQTADLSSEEIMEIASRYTKLKKVRVLIGGDIIIISKADTWVLKNEGNFLALYHRSMVMSEGRMKESYHIQDVFYDLEYALASIVSHDEFVLGIKNRTPEEVNELIC